MDAMDEGEARGLAEGSRRKALETAKNLLHFGLSRRVAMNMAIKKYKYLIFCEVM